MRRSMRIDGMPAAGTPKAAAAAAPASRQPALGITPLAKQFKQAAAVQTPTGGAGAQGRQAARAQGGAQQQQAGAAPAAANAPNARTARLMQLTSAAQPAEVPAAAATGRKRGAGAAGHPAGDRPQSLPDRLAALLESSLPPLMADWAAGALGAKALTFDDAQLLSSCLAPCPREALHVALASPALLLPSCPERLDSSWEDACLAYRLLSEHASSAVGVGDWFSQFCGVLGLQGAQAENEEGGDDAGGTRRWEAGGAA